MLLMHSRKAWKAGKMQKKRGAAKAPLFLEKEDFMSRIEKKVYTGWLAVNLDLCADLCDSYLCVFLFFHDHMELKNIGVYRI